MLKILILFQFSKYDSWNQNNSVFDLISSSMFLTNGQNESKYHFISVNCFLFSNEDFKDRKTVKYEDYSNLTKEEAKKKVQEENLYGLIYIPKQDSLELIAKSVEFFSVSSPGVGTIESLEKKIENRLRKNKLGSLGIDLEDLKSSEFNANIKLNNFSGEKSSKMSSWIKIGTGAISGYLLMMNWVS